MATVFAKNVYLTVKSLATPQHFTLLKKSRYFIYSQVFTNPLATGKRYSPLFYTPQKITVFYLLPSVHYSSSIWK